MRERSGRVPPLQSNVLVNYKGGILSAFQGQENMRIVNLASVPLAGVPQEDSDAR